MLLHAFCSTTTVSAWFSANPLWEGYGGQEDMEAVNMVLDLALE